MNTNIKRGFHIADLLFFILAVQLVGGIALAFVLSENGCDPMPTPTVTASPTLTSTVTVTPIPPTPTPVPTEVHVHPTIAAPATSIEPIGAGAGTAPVAEASRRHETKGITYHE
jgi:hypothetical protein